MGRPGSILLLFFIAARAASADSWQARAPMITARHGLTSASACGAVFTIGGKSYSTDVAVNEAFDPGWNNWRGRTDMPVARNGVASGAVNDKVYVFGGTSSAQANYEYDPSPDVWTAKAPMPTARNEVAAATLAGKIYAVGGKIGGTVTSIMEIYDPAADSWAAGPSMPTPRSGASAAAVNGKIHVFGGYTTTMVYLNTHEVYDTLTRTWATASAMPTARAFMACAAVEGIIYLISGYNGAAHQTRNDGYDADNGTWLTKGPIPTPRKGAGCAAVAGKIYVIGGSNEEYLTVCEEYTPDLIGVEEGAEAREPDRFDAVMTAGGIRIVSAPEGRGGSQIVLYDANGRKQAEWTGELARNSILRPNSGTNFSKGVYFLRITAGGVKTVKKLVCVR